MAVGRKKVDDQCSRSLRRSQRAEGWMSVRMCECRAISTNKEKSGKKYTRPGRLVGLVRDVRDVRLLLKLTRAVPSILPCCRRVEMAVGRKR
jgi:hypothetical protein